MKIPVPDFSIPWTGTSGAAVPPCFDTLCRNLIQDFNVSDTASDTWSCNLSPKRLPGPFRHRVAMPDFQRVVPAL